MSIDQIRQRFGMYLDQTYRDPGSKSRIVIGGALALLGAVILLLCAALGIWQAAGIGVILAAAGGYRFYIALKPQRMYRRMREVANRGVLVTAYLVQANSVLYVPGNRGSYALVVFSFDPRGSDASFMVPIVQHLQKLKGSTSDDPDVAALARRITSEKADTYHRQRIPGKLTGGVEVYMGDIMILPTRLRERYLDRPSLLCLAEKGAAGGIELVPDWLVDEARRADEPRESREREGRPASRH